MLELASLQSFYLKQVDESSSPFEHIVKQFFESGCLCKDIVEVCVWNEPLGNEEKTIDNWKNLLAANLLSHLADAHQSDIAAKISFFEKHPWNQRSQYVRALVALNHALANMPVPDVGINLLEGGAALIDLREYCPWLSLPYTPQHFEFGLYLALLALKSKHQQLKEVVLKLALWQLNTLDANGKPLQGLFVREKDSKSFRTLYISYLFFRAAALLIENPSFAALAEKQWKFIQELAEQEKREKMTPLWPVIEKWLAQYKIVASAPLALPEHIHDTSTALVGYRSFHQHIVCTLHGGHTGLGTVKQKDVEIVNYGPQFLPLSECQGFGIEGNALSDHGIRQSVIELRSDYFCLKGCTRLVDQPIHLSFDAKKFRGIWIEVVQEFTKSQLDIKTNFLGFEGWDAVAFSFFIKAKCCYLESQKPIFPKTIERYEGETQPINLEGERAVLTLRFHSIKGKMQVIPLAGGNNFWGADFLVAYLLNPAQTSYHWQIGPF